MPEPRPEDDTQEEHKRVSILMLLPNMITLMGMCLGLTAIRFAIEGRFTTAVAMILLAMLADGIDGFVARRLGAESAMGAQLDSLSDFLCFGVAPAIVLYQLHLTQAAGFGWIFALLFAAATCLRLARFNVMSGQNEKGTGPKTHFVGVPAPAGASLALLPVFLTLSGLVDLGAVPIVVAIWMAFVGLLMISKLATLAPRSVRVPQRFAAVIMVAMVVVIGLGFTRPWLVLVMINAAYLTTILYALIQTRGRILS
jgi:CDP-diacylglycerol--serine O-phosphatidyltransferase